MKRVKLISVLLATAMLCGVLSGCMAMIGEVTLNADGSGKLKISSGVSEKFLSEDQLAEMKADSETVAFQYNGKTYYGSVETQDFADMTAESNSSERYFRNPDGSWTVWVKISEDTAADMGADSSAEASQEIMDVIMEDLVGIYTLHAPAALTQIAGGKTGITLSGKDLTLDMVAMGLGTDHPQYGTFVFTTAKSVPTFADVAADKWYAPAVRVLALGGMVNGVGSGRFAPENTLTVAQFCQMVARAGGKEIGADASGYWAAKAITACVADGYVKDRGAVTPANYEVPITREEAIAAMTLLTDAIPTEETETAKTSIPDYAQISADYQELIACAYSNGITSGTDAKGTFKPKGELTRAEICQLFLNVGVIAVD